jgi:hypothetical protein
LSWSFCHIYAYHAYPSFYEYIFLHLFPSSFLSFLFVSSLFFPSIHRIFCYPLLLCLDSRTIIRGCIEFRKELVRKIYLPLPPQFVCGKRVCSVAILKIVGRHKEILFRRVASRWVPHWESWSGSKFWLLLRRMIWYCINYKVYLKLNDVRRWTKDDWNKAVVACFKFPACRDGGKAYCRVKTWAAPVKSCSIKVKQIVAWSHKHKRMKGIRNERKVMV